MVAGNGPNPQSEFCVSWKGADRWMSFPIIPSREVIPHCLWVRCNESVPRARRPRMPLPTIKHSMHHISPYVSYLVQYRQVPVAVYLEVKR